MTCKIILTAIIIFLGSLTFSMQKNTESTMTLKYNIALQQEFFNAILRRDYKWIITLLDWGIQINAQDKDGYTALILAADRGDKELVALLLENGADMHIKNNYGYNALHRAALNGRKEVVALLLDKGADINAKDNCGQPALLIAAYGNSKEAVEVLLDKGANINAQDNTGKTALMSADMHFSGYEEVVKLLLDRGVDINAKDNGGFTELHRAVRDSDEDKEIVVFLLDKGADINAQDEWNITPLMLATNNGHVKIAQLLELCSQSEVQEYLKHPQNFVKNYGINFVFDKKQTVLMLACIFGHIDIISLFKASSVEFLNIQDEYSHSAFYYAWTYNKKSSAVLINTFGDSINEIKESSHNLLKEASKMEYLPLVIAILNKGSVHPLRIINKGTEQVGYLNILPQDLFASLLIFLKE